MPSTFQESQETQPNWRKLSVKAGLPESLAALNKLSRNLWMSWNYEALELFEYIDINLWASCQHNPVIFLQLLSLDRVKAIEEDAQFLRDLKKVESRFDAYIAAPMRHPEPNIGYFSMEYGLNNYIRLYSGGLGILAGDYLKEASDRGVNITAVGLLYKNGYFRQQFNGEGEQVAGNDEQDFNCLPIENIKDNDGNPLLLSLPFPERTVQVQVWRLSVGRISLYLLDTDLPQNTNDDRNITSKLYGGHIETRLQQEIILGIVGIQALNAMNIKPEVFHCNEGHAAFIGLERLSNIIDEHNMSFYEALEVVRSTTLFTTHTAVPAANDVFNEDMLKAYLSYKTASFNDNWSLFMGLGRANWRNDEELFSMPYLAAHISKEINGVSKIHKYVSQDLFNVLWKDFRPEELFIDSITNGVHNATWTAKEWQQIYARIMGNDYANELPDTQNWQKIYQVPDSEIWQTRKLLKKRLIEGIKRKLNNSLHLSENPKKSLDTIKNLDENGLIIGFARRFVTYKRSDLLFYDLQRILEIVNNTDKPVRFLFAGKAHPNDQASIEMIRRVIRITEMPQYKNKIIYLENYDMELAEMLVQGVDVWLNTPNRLMEASGTSGMKASMNGVLNFSVLDGWWAEGYNKNIGWAIKEEITFERQDLQDQLDAETIYSTLENEIIPLYFDINSDGLPGKWIEKIRHCIADVSPMFSMTRMIDEYYDMYYSKLYSRALQLKENNYAGARNSISWKRNMLQQWSGVNAINIETNDNRASLPSANAFKSTVTITTNGLSATDIGVEAVISNKKGAKAQRHSTCQLALVAEQDGQATYECSLPFTQPGSYEYTYRLYAKNDLLANRQDFPLLKWV